MRFRGVPIDGCDSAATLFNTLLGYVMEYVLDA
jgi:hypothetical protein